VGKTTTAVTLAHGLAAAGKPTLLIDLDPQGQCATSLGMDQEAAMFEWLVVGQPAAKLLRATGRENLWLLPGDKQTAVAQLVVSAQQQPVSIIADKLKDTTLPDARPPAFVVFDTAPSAGGLQERALWASQHVIIPCSTDFLSAAGVGQISETMKLLRERSGWTGQMFGILPTFFDDVTKESSATVLDLRRHFGNVVWKPIHRATALRESAAEGKTIFEYAKRSRSAKEYHAVVRATLELH
jgi:chromosome partitioning protein